MPGHIYIYSEFQDVIKKYKYFGEKEYEHHSVYIFVRDMGEITFDKFEIDCLTFDLTVNERGENLSTTQKGAQAYRKIFLDRDIYKKKNELTHLEVKIRHIELAIKSEASVV